MSSDGDTRVTDTSTGGTHPIGNAQTLPSQPGTSVERARIGRYQIGKRLGAGGMGEVWEATDPDLGRKVAIKVLHDGVSRPQLAERLKREAQALAKLDHPNVVSVYDVGIDDAGELYIVMQLVAGTTLDHAVRERPARQRIELLVQAGRGLAAAHAAGIVHRDFKPTNVLVDRSGHVRVGDFGLARASHAADEAPELLDGDLATSMTHGGDVVGTPAYMAPEQLRGGPVTHATDQFAFCITLWEALAGERPYEGHNVTTLRDAVVAGKRRELPSSIPRRVRGVLLRGLSTQPGARFPSMTALVEELAPNRRPLWIAGGIGVAGLATSTVLLGVTRTEADPCGNVEAPMDLVWNDQQRAGVRAALGPSATGVIELLDDRSTRWRAMRLDACQASHVAAQPQTLDERDLRNACLDRSLTDERVAIEVLTARKDPAQGARTYEVALGGHDPAECTRKAAADQLARGMQHHADAMLATEVSQAIAKRDAGDLDPFIAQRPKLEPRVLASDDPELVASWQLAVGRTFEERGDEKLARDPLRRAAEAATTARRDDIAAHAWSELAGVLARAGELEGADNLMVAARGAATRVDRPIVAVWLELADGAIAVERGDFAGAMTKCTHAGDAAKRIGDLRGLELDAIGCVYDAQMGNSDFAGAVTSARRRKDIATALFGPDNVSVLEARRAIATALARNGDQAGAVAEWDAVLAGMEKTYGANSLEMMRTLRDYAASQSPGGAETTPKAVAAIRRAAAIADAGHPAAGEHSGILESLGYVESANHDLEASTAAYERAIAILEKLDDPMALARVLYNTADGLKEGKQCDRALPLFDRAARVAASTGQKSMMEAGALYGRGACLGRAKQWDVADDSLRRAFDQFDKLELPLFAAQARWELADQLVMRGKRAEGLAIAKAAADQLAGLPPPAEDLRKQILDWIKKP